MTDYSPEDWKRLGRAVKRARMRQQGYQNTQDWAAAVGRSSRIVLGLERGEPTGEETLLRIETLLGWPTDYAWQILRSAEPPEPVNTSPAASDGRVDLTAVPIEDIFAELARRTGAVEPPRTEP